MTVRAGGIVDGVWYAGSTTFAPIAPQMGIRLPLFGTDDDDPIADASDLQIAVHVHSLLAAFYTNGAGVSSGGKVLINPVDFAKFDESDEAVGDTDGSGDASDTLIQAPIIPGSISLTVGAEAITDDGEGVLTGSGSATGTVNYSTGAITIAGAAASTAIVADYSWRPAYAYMSVTSANGLFVFAGYVQIINTNDDVDSLVLGES